MAMTRKQLLDNTKRVLGSNMSNVNKALNLIKSIGRDADNFYGEWQEIQAYLASTLLLTEQEATEVLAKLEAEYGM